MSKTDNLGAAVLLLGKVAVDINDLQRALSIALKLYETDQLTRLGEHLKASVDPWADRDAEVYGPDMEDER